MSTLEKIKSQLNELTLKFGRPGNSVSLLAVTKNQSVNAIMPLLNQGQRLFGENKVQEAKSKWPSLRAQYSDLELHLIGHLQANKVKEAVTLFDVIETLDSFKLAEKLAKEEQRQKKKLIYYIEVNMGKEPQKSGVFPEDLPAFVKQLQNEFPLKIQGLMCIPPKENPAIYFQQMKNLADDVDFSVLSMGMSEDFPLAIKFGSTLVRIGRALFHN